MDPALQLPPPGHRLQGTDTPFLRHTAGDRQAPLPVAATGSGPRKMQAHKGDFFFFLKKEYCGKDLLVSTSWFRSTIAYLLQ